MEDPMPEQVETPEGGCDPVGSLCWSKLLAGPVDPWREEPMPEQLNEDFKFGPRSDQKSARYPKVELDKYYVSI
ncbi:EH domain-containing protein 4 [Grus japonensis]|uniref:EH domain-containing protein 4 n=1 Tax=Grus japonensis TaxID=30415 RepID=A0ABC9YK23_GRUJA